MEDTISPVKPEKPIITSDATPKQPILGKALIPVSLVVISVVVGAIIFFYRRSITLPNTTTQPTQKIASVSESTGTSPTITEWKTYTNTEAGFTLKYPTTVLFNQETKGATKLALSVGVEKLSSIPEDLPQLMGRTDALKEKDRLAKGEGKNLAEIGSLNGQIETVLSQFEVCSVLLTRKLTFYPSDYRVILTFVGPKDTIVADMPEFFKVDQTNCGSKRVWDNEKTPSFETTLEKKQGKGMAQEWFDTFDAIVKTVILTTPSNTPSVTASADLSVYKNDKYGFEISYPKPYRALEDTDSLSGYPKGVALLYTGGQAYDVVIEVWNTQSEYESNYSSRLSDITVMKSKDKFITLLNNTKVPGNEKIIASLKLLP